MSNAFSTLFPSTKCRGDFSFFLIWLRIQSQQLGDGQFVLCYMIGEIVSIRSTFTCCFNGLNGRIERCLCKILPNFYEIQMDINFIRGN